MQYRSFLLFVNNLDEFEKISKRDREEVRFRNKAGPSNAKQFKFNWF